MPWDRQTFGAAVVNSTLDYMNNGSNSPKWYDSYGPTDKTSFGAAVVNKTLDYMNSPTSGSKYNYGAVDPSYDLNKSVLSAAYLGKGTILDYWS
jgi:hypothetical protein